MRQSRPTSYYLPYPNHQESHHKVDSLSTEHPEVKPSPSMIIARRPIEAHTFLEAVVYIVNTEHHTSMVTKGGVEGSSEVYQPCIHRLAHVGLVFGCHLPTQLDP